MANITFEINGKKVNPNNVKDALEAAMLEGITAPLKKDIGSLSCSEHNLPAKITIKGRSIDTLNFEVAGCCENLVNKVKAKMKART